MPLPTISPIIKQKESAVNSIIPFNFEKKEVRTHISNNGEIMFVGKDVCECLGIKNSRQALSRLDDDEKGVITNDTLGGAQKITVINEAGAYKLIFTSRVPSANRFKKWLAHEVLPSIRKTGSYAASSPAIDLNDPATLRQTLIGYTEKVIEQQAQIEVRDTKIEADAPKVEALDRIECADGLLNLRETAKTIGIPPRRFNKLLLINGYIFRGTASGRWTAKSTSMTQGLLEHKIIRVPSNTAPSGERVYTQVMVTPKGLTKFAQVLGQIH